MEGLVKFAYCSQIPDSDSTDFTEFAFHLKTGDINLIQLTSKKLYWIYVYTPLPD